jgi:hypothetical protein
MMDARGCVDLSSGRCRPNMIRAVPRKTTQAAPSRSPPEGRVPRGWQAHLHRVRLTLDVCWAATTAISYGTNTVAAKADDADGHTATSSAVTARA